MTEEIIENKNLDVQETATAPGAPSGKPLQKKKSLRRKKSAKPKKPKGPEALSDFELVLVTLTGIVTFGGVIFCLVMITLMNTIGY